MCPPGLHISLGIFFRLFLLLVNECHELDLSVPMEGEGSPSGLSYQRYAAGLKALERLRDEQHNLNNELAVLEQQLISLLLGGVSSTTNPTYMGYMSDIKEKEEKLQDLVSIATSHMHYSSLPIHIGYKNRQF